MKLGIDLIALSHHLLDFSGPPVPKKRKTEHKNTSLSSKVESAAPFSLYPFLSQGDVHDNEGFLDLLHKTCIYVATTTPSTSSPFLPSPFDPALNSSLRKSIGTVVKREFVCIF
jgi:hypothetical protein